MPRPLMGFSFRSLRQPLPGSAELASVAGWQPPRAVWGWLPAPGQGALLPSCHQHGLLQTGSQPAEDSRALLSAPALHLLLRPPDSRGPARSTAHLPSSPERLPAGLVLVAPVVAPHPQEAAGAGFPELSLCPGSHPGKHHQLRSGPLGPIVGAGALLGL